MKIFTQKEIIQKIRKILGPSGLGLMICWVFLQQVGTAPVALLWVLFVVSLLLLAAYLIVNRIKIASFLRAERGKRGIQISTSLFLLVGILVMAYYLVSRHVLLRVDLTSNQRHSLSKQSVDMLDRLKEKTQFLLFTYKGHAQAQLVHAAESFLKRYSRRNSSISVRVVDMQLDYNLAKQYGVTDKDVGAVLVLVGKKKKLLRVDDYTQVRVQGQRPYRELRFEESFTRALASLLRGRHYTVYVTTGHGELDFYDNGQLGSSQLRVAMEGDGFVVKRLNLLLRKQIPSDCQVLIIAGGKESYAPQEIAAVEAYLDHGRPAIFMAENDSSQAYKRLLSRWGIIVAKDLIIEPVRKYAVGVNVVSYDSHSITAGLSAAKQRVVLPYAASVRPAAVLKKGSPYLYHRLLFSSKESWGELNSVTAQYNQGERRGPLAYGYAVIRSARGMNMKKGPRKRVRYIVLGDSDFIKNGYLQQFAGNRDFFLNGLQWVLEQPSSITIRPRQTLNFPLSLTEGEANFINLFVKLLMPLAVVLVGFFVYRRRRKHG